MTASRLRRLIRSMDWTSLGAILLAVLACALYLGAVRPLAAKVQSLQARAASPGIPPGAGATAHRSAAEDELGQFYARLPGTGQAADMTRRLHEHARQAGLVLESGDYRKLPGTFPKVIRYQIVLPVKGDYPDLRRFLAAALNDMPALALDAVEFHRTRDASGGIEAQLRFTLFLRAPT